MTANPDHSDFAALVGEALDAASIEHPDVSTALTVTSCSPVVQSGDYSTFTVAFTGGPEARLPQGTYVMSGGSLESAPVFIVPVATSAESTEYEAVFTHLDDAPEAS